MTRPLLVSDDTVLIDEVLRLAAASNVEIHLAPDPESARGQWSLAPLVIVGADQAARVAGMRPERRRDVVIVGREFSDADWQRAVTIGAEHVAQLPDAERWLIDRLADTGEGPPRNGAVISVMSAGGGAGASTFAATLAAAAAADGQRVLLIDLDPLAGGLDVLLGIEGVDATRWDDLADTRGRLSTATLANALPTWAGVVTLSWGRDGGSHLTAEPLASVLDAGERGFDVIVVDVPRVLDDVTEVALGRARRTVLVTSSSVRSVAAASRLARILRERSASTSIVVRREQRGVSTRTIGEVLDDVVGEIPFSAGVVSRCDGGEGPSLRDSYGRAVRRLLPILVDGPAW